MEGSVPWRPDIMTLLEPERSSMVSLISGIVAIISSISFLVLLGFGIEALVLTVPLFALGVLSTVIAGAISIPGIANGDEDQSSRAYLGLGMTIGSVIMLGVGAVIAWG